MALTGSGAVRTSYVNSTKAIVDNDQRSATALSLIDARRYRHGIPDLECRPCVLTSITYSQNVAAPTGQALPTLYLIIIPRASHMCMTLCQLLPLSSIIPTATQNVLVPYQNIMPSRNLATAYTYVRPCGMWVGVQSSTTSTTNAALSGTFSACAFNDINDFTLFNDGEIADLSTTSKDYNIQVPPYSGIVYTPGPEIFGEFFVPSTPSIVSSGREYPISVTTIPASTPAGWYPLNLPANSLFQNMEIIVEIICVNGATITIQPTFAMMTAAGTYGVLWNPYMIVQSPGCYTQQNRYFDSSMSSLINVIPYVLLNTAVTSGTVIKITVRLYSMTAYTRTGPGALVAITGLSAGQSLQIFGSANYEAVPSSAIGRDVKSSSSLHRIRDPYEISLVEALFNSPDSPVKRIYTGSEYNQMLNVSQEYVTRGRMQELSFSLMGLLNSVLNLGSLAAPVVGSLFGPSGAMIGNQVGQLLGGIHTAAFGTQRSYAAAAPNYISVGRGTFAERSAEYAMPMFRKIRKKFSRSQQDLSSRGGDEDEDLDEVEESNRGSSTPSRQLTRNSPATVFDQASSCQLTFQQRRDELLSQPYDFDRSTNSGRLMTQNVETRPFQSVRIDQAPMLHRFDPVQQVQSHLLQQQPLLQVPSLSTIPSTTSKMTMNMYNSQNQPLMSDSTLGPAAKQMFSPHNKRSHNDLEQAEERTQLVVRSEAGYKRHQRDDPLGARAALLQEDSIYSKSAADAFVISRTLTMCTESDRANSYNEQPKNHDEAEL